MGVLTGLKPERVFYYFEEICKIPHGSYNVKAVSDYCVQVAKTLNLDVRQDEEYNVVIKKPASEGYPSERVLMIQGHLDMVCVKDADIDFDFEKDGLNLVVEDGYVHAKGTTLGGDDGIAVAMGLAILEDDSIEHPALEVVFTTEEEVGMEGVIGLDTSDLKASYLLNLDSEEEGHFLAGCAGGVKAHAAFKSEYLTVEGTEVDIKISGLIGGHSGCEIDQNRANAIILLGRMMYELDQNVPYMVREISGGAKDNAIPVEAEMKIVVKQEMLEDVRGVVEDFEHAVQGEFRTSDPGIHIEAVIGSEGSYEVLSMITMNKIMFVLMQTPNGIQTMSADLPGLVESSLNIGVLRTDADYVSMTWALRSSVRTLKILMRDKLQYLIEMMGGEINFHGDYPAWPYNPNSKICALSKKLYEQMYHKDATIEMIHAGLECGILAEKMPALDMVSMGPDMKDIHTSRERMDIASVERVYTLVLEIMKQFADFCN